ncbi:MAG: TetR/AcrR family transcriptional regulator [Chloroflexi bacterium]|nr:MAG: TetR/AcrR family transcriptional regulator [Chloroflexota bacterium]TMD64617.1 MAG: TetR/AcrR family transcriptional regulator [Chloroflexota bacterium]
MPDQTKERIIEAAYRALVKRGYHETSMKDIAAEAGLAPGLAHYYFETKEDLLVATIEHACAPAMRAWEEAGMSLSGPLPENADPMGFARMGFDLAKQELKSYRSLFVLTFDMFGVGIHNPKIAAAVRSFIDERRAFIARITQGVIAGMPEPPTASADAIAAALWGSLHGIYLQKVMDPGFDADAAIDALSEMAIAFATATPTRFRQEG